MTRLHPVLDPESCAELHARLVRLTLEKVVAAQLCPVELWCSPDCRHAFFDACREDYAISLHGQSGADLGLRMHHATSHALAGCDAVILTGTDCPSLAATDIDEACRALLAGTDIVLGPANDGGYYLVGLRSARPEVFSDITWGRGDVLKQTLARVQEQGMQAHLLTRRDDIDTPEDYLCLAGLDVAIVENSRQATIKGN